MLGGEVFVPKIPSYRIIDVAEAIGPTCQKPIIGIRPGEKIHEEMITASDSFTTIDLDKHYAILPSDGRTLVDILKLEAIPRFQRVLLIFRTTRFLMLISYVA